LLTEKIEAKKNDVIVYNKYETNFAPLDKISGYDVRPGLFGVNGATVLPYGVSFTIHSTHAIYCELVLFRSGENVPFASLPFPEHYKVGSVYSMIIYGLDIHNLEYVYRLDGVNDPKRGLLFDKDNLLLDPYARAVSGLDKWGEFRANNTPPYRGRVISDNFDWGGMSHLHIPMADLIIYEMHVRGFTKHNSSGVKSPGTFMGIIEKIPYLKELGVNCLELMPVFEFDEMRNSRVHKGKLLLDYTGYNTVGFFAPKASFSSNPDYRQKASELKELIKTLNSNGIEVILDVVFNHTAEGNEDGSIFSFKGLDNNIYYMLTPESMYYNFSGCGNTMNCNHPIVKNMILECLRYWVIEYRISGFRFDLASILGRNVDGSPMSSPPLLKSLAYDPVLCNVKLIAEAWDAGGMYQVGTFPSWNRWAEWNGRYRDELRCFLKGDNGFAWNAAERIAGSHDMYNPINGSENPSVNFLNCHDGYTLYDMYTYQIKHNYDNGWNCTDGDNNNNSWNCGIEGETDDPVINSLRKRLIKNAVATLMCSRGTPMFFMGDEFCNTQFGNNNAYCQDNEISWLDWGYISKHRDIFEFFKFMISFRKKHDVVRKETKLCSCDFPSVSFHGEKPWKIESDHVIGVMFAGQNEDGQDDIVLIIINAYWESMNIELPQLPKNMDWKIEVNTSKDDWHDNDPYNECSVLVIESHVSIKERSTIVLTAQKQDLNDNVNNFL